jgi:outer membrane protein assembly factor BamB
VTRKERCARRAGALALAALVGCLAYPGVVLPGADATKPQVLPPHAWPMFGGTPARNMVNLRDMGVPTAWSVEGGKLENVRWVADVGTHTYGSPVIAGGRIFIGTNNGKPRDAKVKGAKAVLMCFRLSDGKFLWQAVHDMPPPEVQTAAKAVGLCSTPTVEGERVYYVSPSAVVVCAEAGSGKAVWQFDMMKELGVFPCYVATCSPLVIGDRVFVVTGNGIDDQGKLVAPKAPSFLALNKRDGKVLWQSNLPGARIIEGQWSNPAYAVVDGKGQVIFAGGDGYLYGLEPGTGKMIWKFNGNAAKQDLGPRRNKAPNYFLATPAIHDGKVYVGMGVAPEAHIIGNSIGRLWCVGLGKHGDVSPVGGNLDPKAPANKDSGLVWTYGGPVLPPPKLGGRSEYFGLTLSTVAVHEGLVYANEERGYLHCLDAVTGKQYWEHDFKTGVPGSPYWVDGKVYVGTEDGDVVIFAHGRQKKVLGTVSMDEVVRSAPVAVDGVLYVATDSKLYAIGKK